MRFLTNLQRIDRRIMYILLAIVVWIPLRWDIIHQPLPVTPEVRGAYKAVEDVPKGKIVFISIWWSAGTLAENRPQTEAVARHLFMLGKPFAIIPWDQQGTTLSYNTVKAVADEMHKEYGKDWMAFGYQPVFDQTLQGMAVSIPGTLKKDKNGTPLSDIPMMKNIRTARDIGLVFDVTPSQTLPSWINFIGQPYKVPLIYGPTGVMVPEGYNYLDSKQIKGMLPGLIGATKYEQLIHQRGFATRAANALSTSHGLIILLIVLGNIGYFLSRRQQESR